MSQPNTRIVVFLLGLFVTAVRWNLKKNVSVAGFKNTYQFVQTGLSIGANQINVSELPVFTWTRQRSQASLIWAHMG